MRISRNLLIKLSREANHLGICQDNGSRLSLIMTCIEAGPDTYFLRSQSDNTIKLGRRGRTNGIQQKMPAILLALKSFDRTAGKRLADSRSSLTLLHTDSPPFTDDYFEHLPTVRAPSPDYQSLDTLGRGRFRGPMALETGALSPRRQTNEPWVCQYACGGAGPPPPPPLPQPPPPPQVAATVPTLPLGNVELGRQKPPSGASAKRPVGGQQYHRGEMEEGESEAADSSRPVGGTLTEATEAAEAPASRWYRRCVTLHRPGQSGGMLKTANSQVGNEGRSDSDADGAVEASKDGRLRLAGFHSKAGDLLAGRAAETSRGWTDCRPDTARWLEARSAGVGKPDVTPQSSVAYDACTTGRYAYHAIREGSFV
ncbi:unnamed protein product [Protopolystoma xenopodis]|uniref:Uncharacterized protein n=1 Tax=Protopolystoma xenopodis TaxID=117903 RepID=A0A3S5BRT4_9PLAT|nr:unnamed protein product [Protopolystoma xenopodis]